MDPEFLGFKKVPLISEVPVPPSGRRGGPAPPGRRRRTPPTSSRRRRSSPPEEGKVHTFSFTNHEGRQNDDDGSSTTNIGGHFLMRGPASDLGDASRWRLRGEAEWLRLLRTSPLRGPETAAAAAAGFLAPSSSDEEEDPDPETNKQTTTTSQSIHGFHTYV